MLNECTCVAQAVNAPKGVKNTKDTPYFTTCCAGGQVSLPSRPTPPPALLQLYTGQHEEAKTFRQELRSLNTIFQFTSCGAKLDPHMIQGIGNFRICGSVYHKIGSLLPAAGQQPRYAQLYCYDAQHELKNRQVARPEISATLLATLQALLHKHNHYAKEFKAAASTTAPKFKLSLSSSDGVFQTSPLRSTSKPHLAMCLYVLVQQLLFLCKHMQCYTLPCKQHLH